MPSLVARPISGIMWRRVFVGERLHVAVSGSVAAVAQLVEQLFRKAEFKVLVQH